MDFKQLTEKETWLQLLDQVKETAETVADKAQTGAAMVACKADDAIARARLQRRMKDLEEEIDLQLAEIGALVYATHTGTPSDSREMQEILTYIDGLYQELDAHERQLRMMQGFVYCPVCGAENPGANAFCQDCGKNLTDED